MVRLNFAHPALSNVCLSSPQQVIVAHAVDQVRPALKAVERAAEAGNLVVGYISYEAAPAFEPALVVQADYQMPLVWFAVFAMPSVPLNQQEAGDIHHDLDWQPSQSQARYDTAIATIREAIAAGETYQVNYTLRMRAAFTESGEAFYNRVHAAHPAPYSAYLDTGRFKVLSLSPELFFHRRQGQITTRPMKGTVARGRWPEEDHARAAWLAASEKNRAENLMIVDLLRNDLGRIARVGSVRVPALFTIERYPTVWQMTSTITAEERPGVSLDDVFTALFPCGSVTGAPKVNTMRLISTLEDSPREVYCGAIGAVLPGGEAVFNVAIRTVVIDTATNIAHYGVGGGITYDSQAADEYDEVLAKMAVLREQRPAFDLLETLRLKRGRYTLLHGHLRRLEQSAAYFGIPVSLAAVRDTLFALARKHSTGTHKARLLVSATGEISVAATPLHPPSTDSMPVALAATPIAKNDRFLFHKTTNRSVYEQARAARPDVFDVLLWNEDGELTEFTIGNLVIELDGRLWTPPQASGLLAGVLREALVQRGTIAERVITRHDLHRSTRIWLINSVRGWVRVFFTE